MEKERLTAKEIRSRLQATIDNNREIREDEATLVVGEVNFCEARKDGCNWTSPTVSGSDGHEEYIIYIITELQKRVILKSGDISVD